MVPTGSSSSSSLLLLFLFLLRVRERMCVGTHECREFRSQLLRPPGHVPLDSEIGCLIETWDGRLGKLAGWGVHGICLCLPLQHCGDRCIPLCPAFYKGDRTRHQVLMFRVQVLYTLTHILYELLLLASRQPLLTSLVYTWAWPRRGWNSLSR